MVSFQYALAYALVYGSLGAFIITFLILAGVGILYAMGFLRGTTNNTGPG